MNRHFDRRNDGRADVPPRAYARVDHVERDDRRPDTVLIGIDLIDADWLDARGADDELLDLSAPPYKLARLWRQQSRSLGPGSMNPLSAAPLFRLELEVSSGDAMTQTLQVPDRRDPAYSQAAAAFERQWFTLELSPGKNIDNTAFLYGGLFAPATPVTVKGAMPSKAEIATALSAMFSIEHLPRLNAAGLAQELDRPRLEADYLAVYDVGQGNANALAVNRGPLVPTMYFDLGAGVYRNAKTTPRICASVSPTTLQLFYLTGMPTTGLAHMQPR